MAKDAGRQGSQPEQENEQQGPSTSVQSTEPKDATQAGGKQPQQKRELGLNVEGKQAHRPPGTPAGQHATGSFSEPSKHDSNDEKSPGK